MEEIQMTKKRICAISIGIVLVIALIVSSVLLFGGKGDKPTNATEDTTSESLQDESSSEKESYTDTSSEEPTSNSEEGTTETFHK